jgi:hypothetical protein
MSEEIKKRPKDTANDIISCGNCGRRIQPHQASTEVFNTRHKGYEHYHESYLGCYESTRESGKKVVLNRYKPWLHNIYNDPSEPVDDGAKYTNIIDKIK